MKQMVFLLIFALLCLPSCSKGGGSNSNFTSASDSTALGSPFPPGSAPPPTATPGNIDTQLSIIIAQEGLNGDPSQGINLPNISDPVAQLGKKLFFSKALSGEMDVACVSCHHPSLGGGDGLPLSIGVDADSPDLLGPGRTHPAGFFTVPRNAPTTFNMGLWRRVLFLDGRIERLLAGPPGGPGGPPGGPGGNGIRTPDSSFGVADPLAGNNLTEAQSRFPVTSEVEMKGFIFESGNTNESVRDHLQARLGDYGMGTGELILNNWLQEFQEAFNSSAPAQTLVTYENIARALGAYENSQVFVETPWKNYVQGNLNAMTPAAKRGALLFYQQVAQGGASCVSCHSGDFFTDERFHVLAVPQIGAGKGDGITGDDDFGRFRETGNPIDLYAFRTPTLLNVEVTGPFGHDGAYETLEGIVRHHLNPATAITNYNFEALDSAIQKDNALSNTLEALNKLEANRASGIPSIANVTLTDAQISDLVEFLRALTDPCVQDRNCLQPWIPEDSEVDPDGLRLNTVDSNGNPY